MKIYDPLLDTKRTPRFFIGIGINTKPFQELKGISITIPFMKKDHKLHIILRTR